MRKSLIAAICLGLALPLLAAEPATPVPAPSPSEIVEAAKAEEWVSIAPADLLVMDLAGRPDGKVLFPRRVVIQLMPPPFSQNWVGNVRKLAAAHWWDGLSINRVQDNYVVQWGDASEKKALPEGLAVVPQNEYVAQSTKLPKDFFKGACPLMNMRLLPAKNGVSIPMPGLDNPMWHPDLYAGCPHGDAFSIVTANAKGFPFALGTEPQDPIKVFAFPEPVVWPVHCYAMVGVGRNLPPDTGSGAELYTVIGHAPRHLDRNIALVGRVIEGIEHLSSLPRGTGPLGFYEHAAQRVPIRSIRLGTEVTDLPGYQYLSTESASFARYAEARANRRDAFFVRPAGGADICNIPVPVRRVKG